MKEWRVLVAETIRVVCRGVRITFDKKLLFRVASIYGSGVLQLGLNYDNLVFYTIDFDGLGNHPQVSTACGRPQFSLAPFEVKFSDGSNYQR